MITDNILKSLSFDAIDDYYDYIIDVKISGREEMALSLIEKMSPFQRSCFGAYLTQFIKGYEYIAWGIKAVL